MGYKIIKNIAILSKKGMWIKEFNVVRWYDQYDRFDIREWSQDHKHMNRGITLTDEEMANLIDAIDHMFCSCTDDSE